MTDTFLFYTSDKKNIKAPLGLKGSSLFLETLYNDFSGDLSEPIPLEIISSATLKATIEKTQHPRSRRLCAVRDATCEMGKGQSANRQRLFDLIVAANFLDLEFILQWSCWKAATMMNKRKNSGELVRKEQTSTRVVRRTRRRVLQNRKWLGEDQLFWGLSGFIDAA